MSVDRKTESISPRGSDPQPGRTLLGWPRDVAGLPTRDRLRAGEGAMRIRGLGKTVLGIYLVAVGVVPYLPLLSGLAPLVSLLAIVAGVLILLERRV